MGKTLIAAIFLSVISFAPISEAASTFSWVQDRNSFGRCYEVFENGDKRMVDYSLCRPQFKTETAFVYYGFGYTCHEVDIETLGTKYRRIVGGCGVWGVKFQAQRNLLYQITGCRQQTYRNPQYSFRELYEEKEVELGYCTGEKKNDTGYPTMY